MALWIHLPPSLAAGAGPYTLATGGEQGCYHAVGSSIARLAKEKRALDLQVKPSHGSVENIQAVLAGKADFGLAQSDRVLQARQGKAEWQDKGPQGNLRAVAGLYNESLVLIASAGSGVKECRDLRGKKIAVGKPGSGMRQNAVDALESCNLTLKDLALAAPINAEEALRELQAGKLDAFFYTAGHPNRIVKQAVKGKVKVRLIGFPDVCRDRSFCYVKSWISLDLYPGLLNKGYELQTCGVKAVLVASAKTPDKVVYKLMELLGQNLDQVKAMHPSLRRLELHDMVDDLHAPLHPGAERYFQEKGLVK
ncbi:hypothetical protein AAU61_08170 [Desulfocarbo indianensis]|nr:hypothetical protein AAU61_08170 [Desulfocarbo indianensis]